MSHASSIAFRKLFPGDFVREFLKANTRPDGRSLKRVRKTTTNPGSITNADGSSMVRIGETCVVAAVSLIPVSPLADAQGKGVIDVNVQLSPLCSSLFQKKKTDEEADRLKELITRILTLPQVINLDQLCIEFGKAVWCLQVIVNCINHDGNLVDACLLAATVAVCNTHLPAVFVDESGQVSEIENTPPRKLKFLAFPVSLTHAIIDDYLLVDPTMEEEQLSSAKFTTIVISNSNDVVIEKDGGTPVSTQQLRDAIQGCKKRAQTVRAMLINSVV